MGFGRDRPQRHRAGGKALDDLGSRLDLVDRDRTRRLDPELEEPAKRHVTARLVVDQLGVFLVGLEVARLGRMLELGDRIRRPHVLFAAGAIGIFAASLECIGEHRIVAEGRAMHAQRLFGHLEDANTLDVGAGAAEVLVDQLTVEADCLEDLCAGVGHVGRDAHLRHDLVQTLADRLDVVLDRLVGRQVGTQTGMQLGEGFHCEIGMDRLGTETCQQREVMDLAG